MGALTKLSFISMLFSLVSAGAVMSKFLTIVATIILNIACARFCPNKGENSQMGSLKTEMEASIPPQTLEPVPNAIICWFILVSSAVLSQCGVLTSSQRSGRKVSGEGKTEVSRCADQA